MRAWILIAIAGCSSSSSSSTGITELPATKSLDSLSAVESKQYCEDLLAYNKRTVPAETVTALRCTTVALQTTMTGGAGNDEAVRAVCKKTYDECVAKPLPAVPQQCDDAAIHQFATCKGVTIADSNACVLEGIAAQTRLLKRDSCATVTRDSVMDELQERAMHGVKCMRLSEACTNHFKP